MSRPCTAIALAQKLFVRALPTMASSPAPRFFIARATEPMFPEPRGRTMTIRRFSSMRQGGHGMPCPYKFSRLSLVELFRKWTRSILLDDRSVFRVEFGSKAKLFVHQRIPVVNMFGAENVAHLVDQGNHVELGLRVGSAILKNLGDRHDHIATEALGAVADPMD